MKTKERSEFGRGGELNTIIGKGTVVEGDMRVQNSIRIDGRIKGKISITETAIIGKDGEVEGRINAKHVMLAGKVQGNIVASGKVLLESKASVLGNIKASRLVVDEGALFDGNCHMKEGKELKESTEEGSTVKNTGE